MTVCKVAEFQRREHFYIFKQNISKGCIANEVINNNNNHYNNMEKINKRKLHSYNKEILHYYYHDRMHANSQI